MGYVRLSMSPIWRLPTVRQWADNLVYRLNAADIRTASFAGNTNAFIQCDERAALDVIGGTTTNGARVAHRIDTYQLAGDGDYQDHTLSTLPMPTTYELDRIRTNLKEAARFVNRTLLTNEETRRMIEETLWYGTWYAGNLDQSDTPVAQCTAHEFNRRVTMWIKAVRSAATRDHRMIAAITLKLLPAQAFKACADTIIDDVVNALHAASIDGDGGIRFEATTALAKISRDNYLRNNSIIDNAASAMVATMSDAKSSSAYGEWAVVQLIRGFEKLLSHPERSDELTPPLTATSKGVAHGLTLLNGFKSFGPTHEIRGAAKTALDAIHLRLHIPTLR